MIKVDHKAVIAGGVVVVVLYLLAKHEAKAMVTEVGEDYYDWTLTESNPLRDFGRWLGRSAAEIVN